MENVMLVLLLAIGVIELCLLFMIIGMNKKINLLKQLLAPHHFEENPLPPPPPPTDPYPKKK